ncbi:MAG: hypothetical protein A2Z79_10085 [Deltaproteobacteria bacterium GWA2_55_82]|nr:MAG: hypothetical protein A2Z79_10085 [Deltaproteobacteria bacterium GWA2_55_82]
MKAVLKNLKKMLSGRDDLPLPEKAVYSPAAVSFTKIRSMPGWFTFDDCSHFSLCLGLQRAMGINGDILEIGCFHGRSTAVIAGFLEKGERLFVCDIFEGGDKGVYGDCPTPEKVLANILAVNPGLDAETIEIIKGDSSRLSLSPGERFRFVHIDGGHTYNECLSDLKATADHVVSGGIIVIDDYRHPDWPEVTAAADDFLRERRDYAVFADLNRAHAIGRKLYLIRRNG